MLLPSWQLDQQTPLQSPAPTKIASFRLLEDCATASSRSVTSARKFLPAQRIVEHDGIAFLSCRLSDRVQRQTRQSRGHLDVNVFSFYDLWRIARASRAPIGLQIGSSRRANFPMIYSREESVVPQIGELTAP